MAARPPPPPQTPQQQPSPQLEQQPRPPFQQQRMPPPPQQQGPPPTQQPPPPTPSTTSTATIGLCPCPQNDEDVRNALLEFYKSDCCFDERPARRMTISAITEMHAYRLIFESFVEVRQILVRSITYSGPPLPPPKGPPEKWAVAVTPPKEPPGQLEIDFPETAIVVPCSVCGASGFVVCPDCGGLGCTTCYRCFGLGYTTESHHHGSHTSFHEECCWCCHGTGDLPCHTCHTSGRVTCPQCGGHRFMKNWNYLKVIWLMDVQTHNTVRGELVSAQLEQAKYSGSALVSKLCTPHKPKALYFTPDDEITQAADKLMKQVLDPKRDWKVFTMRQSVVVVPVVKVDYQYRKIVSRFYIYGAMNRVFFPEEYPGCCCGCFCCNCCCDGCCTIV